MAQERSDVDSGLNPKKWPNIDVLLILLDCLNETYNVSNEMTE